MSDIFDAAIQHTIGLEGGYSNDANDRGGATMWGITEAEARAWGYKGDMHDFPRDTAVAIYRADYVVHPQFDLLAGLDPALAASLFDSGVNLGPVTVSKFVQRALNVLNYTGLYQNLQVDGVLGRMSRSAIADFYGQRGPQGKAVLLMMVQAQQAVRYMEICEGDPTQKEFLFGWEADRATPQA